LVLVSSTRSSPYKSLTDIIPSPPSIVDGKKKGEPDYNWKVEEGQDFVANGGIVVTPKLIVFQNTVGGISPPPLGASALSSFDIEYSWNWAINDPGGMTLGSSTGVSAGKLFVGGLSYLADGTAVYETEFMQLDLLALNGLPPGIPLMKLRESPTLASTGKTSIRALPDGNFLIDNFFDVFLELSLDDGQSWIPGSGAFHFETTPEPSSLVLVAIAGAIAAWVRRRRS
jgi:hypothetical protein